MPWEECVQAADRAPRGSLILIQSTEEGFMDEGQLLRVSIAKHFLYVLNLQGGQRDTVGVWSTLCDSGEGRRE